MDISTRLFWILVVGLASGSVFFALNAEARRRTVQASEAPLETGMPISLERIINGDTLVVKHENGTSVVRLSGIEAFPVKSNLPLQSRIAREAVRELSRLFDGHIGRVSLSDPPMDASRRYVAQIFVEGKDVGLDLVEQGSVLVDTRNPFADMDHYLRAQAKARADRRGLWGDKEAARLALSIQRSWATESSPQPEVPVSSSLDVPASQPVDVPAALPDSPHERTGPPPALEPPQ